MYTILTRDQCNFCDLAKALLKSTSGQYAEYNVQNPRAKWVVTLLKQAGITTVPQVFGPKGELIGGYTELQELLIDNSSKEF